MILSRQSIATIPGGDTDAEYEKLSPEEKAQVDRAMRNYERRCRREKRGTERGYDIYGGKMYIDLDDWAGQ